MTTELELELEETTEPETQTKSRAGYQSPMNRKITAEMVANELELAYQVAVARIVEAFDNKEAFLEFCKGAWDYKISQKFAKFNDLIQNMTDDEKQALLAQLQPSKPTTRKKTVVVEE